MQLPATNMPCIVSEPAGFRLVRQAFSWCTVAASTLVAFGSTINLLAFRQDPNRIASIALTVVSYALVAATIASLHKSRRFPVLTLSLVAVVALSFTGPSGNTAEHAFSTSRVAHGTVLVPPLLLCIACVVLTNQVAFWMTRRHACACD